MVSDNFQYEKVSCKKVVRQCLTSSRMRLKVVKMKHFTSTTYLKFENPIELKMEINSFS